MSDHKPVTHSRLHHLALPLPNQTARFASHTLLMQLLCPALLTRRQVHVEVAERALGIVLGAVCKPDRQLAAARAAQACGTSSRQGMRA